MKKLIVAILSLSLVFCFFASVPAAAAKEVTLVWGDESTDGAWFKIPAGVTVEAGDTLYMPAKQYLVTTPDGTVEGVPINVGTKNDNTKWDSGNWGQPWKNGDGKGFPITVKEGENNVYCFTIFGDGVSNVDGKYGATDLDGAKIINLIKFNSGDTGVASDDDDTPASSAASSSAASSSAASSSETSSEASSSETSVSSTDASSETTPTFSEDTTTGTKTEKVETKEAEDEKGGAKVTAIVIGIIVAIAAIGGGVFAFIKSKGKKENEENK